MHRLDYIGILAILLLLGLRESTDLYTQIPGLNPYSTTGGDAGAAPWDDGVLMLDLVARDSAWLVREERAAPTVIAWDVGAGTTADDAITRVPQGTLVQARIHNATSTPLEVSGPWSQGRTPIDQLLIPPFAENTVWFLAGERGRFAYRAIEAGEARARGEPRSFSGAFVVVRGVRLPR